jgi:LCP family protein required for cell wall assembly
MSKPSQAPDRRSLPQPAGRRRRRRVLIVLGILGAVVVLVAGATFLSGVLMLRRYDRSLAHDTLLVPGARSTHRAQATVTGPLNFLLVGSDRQVNNPDMGQRSDTIIMAHIPKTMDRVYLISIPRDLLVTIPPFPATDFTGDHTKINAAFQYGHGGRNGVQLLSATLARLTGVRFDGAVAVDFDGLKGAVGALGGVRICVDVRTVSVHTNHVFEPGCRRMDPPQVLDYLRQRETLPDGDYGRQRHQQQFLKAVLAEALSQKVALNPLKLSRLLRVVSRSMTVDFGSASVSDLIYALRGVRPGALVGIRLPSYPDMIDKISYVLDDGPRTASLYGALRNDTLDRWVTRNKEWVNPI